MTLSAPTSIRRRTAVLLAATAVLLGCAASAQRASALEVGVNDDAVLLNGQYYSRTVALQQARAMGATWVRVNFTYADYARPKNHFAAVDGLVAAAKTYGMSVYLTLTGTSQQDKKGSKTIGYNKPNVKKYAAWVKTVAKHLKGKVRRYAIWNEPQFPYFLSPTSTGPAQYCNLYKAGYAALKSVDKKNKVLWGELAPRRDPLKFLARAACRGTKTDGLAFHPYAIAPGVMDIYQTKKIRAAAKKYLHTGNLYYTEFGYLSLQSGSVFGKPDSQRAALTVAGYKYAKKNASKYGIKNLTYYILVHPPFQLSFDSGIINADSSPTPVYTALRNFLVFGLG
jgi:hypothetical protein